MEDVFISTLESERCLINDREYLYYALVTLEDLKLRAADINVLLDVYGTYLKAYPLNDEEITFLYNAIFNQQIAM